MNVWFLQNQNIQEQEKANKRLRRERVFMHAGGNLTTFHIFTFIAYVWRKGFAGLMGLEMGLGWHPLGGGPVAVEIEAPPEAPDEEDMVEHFLNLN